MEAIHPPVRRPDTSELRVSRYEQVASLLVALLLLTGVAVAGMFIIWLTMATLVFKPDPTIVTPVPGGRDDHEEGLKRDLEAPGMEEMPELAEPQVAASVEVLTEAVASVAALNLVKRAPKNGKGDGGLGDGRPPGPPGEPLNVIPAWDRWEIRFESSSINAYARQLDHFKIELGAVGGGKTHVDYAYNLAQSRPDSRSNSGKEEMRLYMTWRAGTLRQFDRELLRRAGVNSRNRVVLQFYPRAVEEELAMIEREHANMRGKTPPEYLKTIFGIDGSASGWRFTVLEQRFRPAPK